MHYRKESRSVRFRWLAIVFLLALVVVLVGCAQSTPTPTPTSTPVPTLPPPTAVPSATKPPATATPAPTLAPMTSAECLACHGPFEKVVAASTKYIAESGENANPHTTVDETQLKPHSTGKGIIECSKCHKPHPQPVASAKDVPPANTDYCYFQCHHRGNLSPCTSCHKNDTYATWIKK
jgi:hypothetical protein